MAPKWITVHCCVLAFILILFFRKTINGTALCAVCTAADTKPDIAHISRPSALAIPTKTNVLNLRTLSLFFMLLCHCGYTVEHRNFYRRIVENNAACVHVGFFKIFRH